MEFHSFLAETRGENTDVTIDVCGFLSDVNQRELKLTAPVVTTTGVSSFVLSAT